MNAQRVVDAAKPKTHNGISRSQTETNLNEDETKNTWNKNSRYGPPHADGEFFEKLLAYHTNDGKQLSVCSSRVLL